MKLDYFSKYKPIIDDWQAFADKLTAPLPTGIWCHPDRMQPVSLAERLERDGFPCSRIPWLQHAFELPPQTQLGNRIEYLSGLIQIQESVAMLPALILAPRPGERVLDLCASPGNKTAQMALMMKNRGTLIANDLHVGRMRPLRRTIERLGLTNVTTTVHDATSYPGQPELFDRVLVDAPCSCEGTSRKNPEVIGQLNDVHTEKMTRVQTAILRRALQLCRVGGNVLYSTCTYAPEENEMVIQTALDSLREKIAVRIVPPSVPDILFSPGLKQWQQHTFRSDMLHAIRIYPHQNDTGGFFIALIEKVGDSRSRTPTNINSDNLNFEETATWFHYIWDRFGIAQDQLGQHQILRRPKYLSLVSADHGKIANPPPHSIGVSFLRHKMKTPKPTTSAMFMLGSSAAENVIRTEKGGADQFFRGESIPAEEQEVNDARRGFVLLKCEGIPLGIGFLKNGMIQSLYPKAWCLPPDCSAFTPYRPSH